MQSIHHVRRNITMRFLEFLGRQAVYFINKMRVIQRSPSAYCSHCGISPSFVARLYTALALNRLCLRGRYDIHAERGGDPNCNDCSTDKLHGWDSDQWEG